jgi:hypothetical protein
MMEYADPQLMSNLSAVSVTVICPLKLENLLIQHCMLFAMSNGPSGLHQQHLFCHLGTSPPIGMPSFVSCSFLCIVLTFFVLEGFTPSPFLSTKVELQHIVQ